MSESFPSAGGAQANVAGGVPSLVVGFGASAGGIGALQEFFRTCGADTGAAFVVILHLSPEHESHASEILQSSSSMPVIQVQQRTELRGDHVYVIPPNRTLESSGGAIQVREMLPEHRRAPVDLFFRTLAEAHRNRAVAIVLSGTGPDGSAGIKRIKELGGLVIAQLPDDAEHDDMPWNAIRTGVVDLILPAAEMPRRIAAYQQRLARDGREVAVRIQESSDTVRDILSLLRSRTGNDFSNYKPSTVLRRIERRQRLHSLDSLADYARLLRERPDEAGALMKDLLISVTSFFRDREAFAALETAIVPAIVERRHGQQVRAWVAGCATGEEAYSIAMTLAECADAVHDPPGIQVFASDLDERAIAAARQGVYNEAEIADVSLDRLRRFFRREAGGYRIRRELRDMVLFAHHNLLNDPPFSQLDLISCRNLLIYLNRPVQERIIETFHRALRPGGYLFLGASESPDAAGGLFAPVNARAHIYMTTAAGAQAASPEEDTPRVFRQAAAREPSPIQRISPAELHHRVLENLAPPSVVVTDDLEVVHLSERVGRYLQVGGGEPTRDLYKLLRPDLRNDVRTAVQQARQQRRPVTVRGVRIDNGLSSEHLDITVRPVFGDGNAARGYLLILFAEGVAPQRAEDEPLELTSPASMPVGDLEEELTRTKAMLRASIERYEAHAEEAKRANEELRAANEELRSAAEELETSKEELQSVNEELSTVNQELKIKVDELALTNNDIRNLINATDIATIFLDRSLRVKMSTPRAQDVFSLLPADIGRPLSDIATKLLHEGLHDDVKRVMDTLHPVEREVPAKEERWYHLRIHPYRTIDDRIDGVVMILQDVTERHGIERRVRLNEERLRLLVESATDYAILTITLEGRIESWNPGAERMFGYAAEEIVGRDASILFTPEDRAARVPQVEMATAMRTGRADDERWHVRKDGRRIYCSGVMMRLGGVEPIGYAKIARDLTASREVEQELKNAREELESRVRERTGALQAEVAERSAAEEHVTNLLRKLVTAQEDERARIARDLHDQLGQQLTALRLSLERHQQQCQAGSQRDEMERALALARAIDEEVGFLAWELRPAALDDLGLGVALPQYVKEWSQHYGIAGEVRTSGYARGQLSPDAEVTFYRVAQEALNNVAKHAHASRVDVILETRDSSVVLLVEDNGAGFDTSAAASSRGVGLLGMRERAAAVGAELEVESRPGDGTTVFLRCAASEAGRV